MINNKMIKIRPSDDSILSNLYKISSLSLFHSENFKLKSRDNRLRFSHPTNTTIDCHLKWPTGENLNKKKFEKNHTKEELPNVILDLDETLLSSVFKSYPGQEVESTHSFKIRQGEGFVTFRKNLVKLLRELKEHYTIWVYSNGLESYVKCMVNLINNEEKSPMIAKERVRWRIGNSVDKDLSKIASWTDLKNFVILDDRIDVYKKSYDLLQSKRIYGPAFIHAKIFYGFENLGFDKIKAKTRMPYYLDFWSRIRIPTEYKNIFLEKNEDGDHRISQLECVVRFLVGVSKEFRVMRKGFPNLLGLKKFTLRGLIQERIQNMLQIDECSLAILNKELKSAVVSILTSQTRIKIVNNFTSRVIIVDQYDHRNIKMLRTRPELLIKFIVRIEYIFDFFFNLRSCRIKDYLINDEIIPKIKFN